jgi:hypothetical protein
MLNKDNLAWLVAACDNRPEEFPTCGNVAFIDGSAYATNRSHVNVLKDVYPKTAPAVMLPPATLDGFLSLCEGEIRFSPVGNVVTPFGEIPLGGFPLAEPFTGVADVLQHVLPDGRFKTEFSPEEFSPFSGEVTLGTQGLKFMGMVFPSVTVLPSCHRFQAEWLKKCCAGKLYFNKAASEPPKTPEVA